MDFQNRQYDPQIGRFLSVDPLADDGQEEWSPYAAMGNNPAMMVDPLGLKADMGTIPYVRLDAPGYMAGMGGKKDNSPGSKDRDGSFEKFLKGTTGAAIAEGMRLRVLAHAFKEAWGLVSKAAERAEAANNEMAASTKYDSPIGPMPDDGGTGSDDPDPQHQFWEDKKPNKGKLISLPSIDKMLENYPLGKTKPLNLRGYENECAIRWSWTLRESGVNLFNAGNFDGLTDDGLIRMASNSARWFAYAYGPPIEGSAQSKYGPKVLTTDEFRSKYHEQKGIIYSEFTFGPEGRGTGHIDFYDGNYLSTPGSIRYLYNPNAKIWFWPLK